MQKPLILKVVAVALAAALLCCAPAAYSPATQALPQEVVQNEAPAQAQPAVSQTPTAQAPAVEATAAQPAAAKAATKGEVVSATIDAVQKNAAYVQQAISEGSAILFSSITLPYASANNPKGYATELPLPKVTGKLLNSSTKAAAELIVTSVLYQIITGEENREAMRYFMEAMPYMKDVTFSEVDAKEAAVIDGVSLQGGGTIAQNADGILGLFQNGVNDLYIFLIPTGQENLYEIAGTYALDDGTMMVAVSGIYMDTNKGLLYTRDEKGLFGLSYCIDYTQYLLYTEKNSPQRYFGFMELYDKLAIVMAYDIDTFRIFFNYNNYDYMFQVWKGNYALLSNGCEQGMYKKPETRTVKFYDCSDEEFPMAMTLYHKGEKMFSRDWYTWWLSGFKIGPLLEKSDLQMEGHITIDNKEMRDVMFAAFQEQLPEGSTVSLKDNTISYYWQ